MALARRIVVTPDCMNEQKNRLAVATGAAAVEARSRAAAIPDLVVPAGFSQLATDIARMRQGVCLALDTLADRSKALELRLEASISHYSQSDERVAGHITRFGDSQFGRQQT